LEAVDRIDPSGPILLAPFFTQILEKIKNDSENSKKY